MDYDADGDIDILSGSYTGEIYLFERGEDGELAQGRYLFREDGKPLKVSTSITPEAVDMDADGDLDLVVGTRSSGVKVVTNVGTRAKPIWSTEFSQLMTVDGQKIKGSNAHHADWDGDGLADLIVGSENGGASWHRNTGKANAPVYAAAAVLVGTNDWEEFSEADGPAHPGARSKVHVTDWNGDGAVDLLIGDVQWLYETLPPLTSEQEAEKAALTPAYEAAEAALNEAYKVRNKSVRSGGGVTDEIKRLMDEASEAFSPLSKKMSVFDRKISNTHGWVWLYQRTPKAESKSEALRASQEFGPTTLRVSASPLEDGSGRLHIESTLSLKRGWHVYASVAADSSYPKTQPSLSLADGSAIAAHWTTTTAETPDPKSVERSWYTDSVTFACDIQAPAGGIENLAVRMHFQVCKEDLCLPPKMLSVTFEQDGLD